MKVNAGGCTHQYKLEVDSVFNVFTLRINFMHLRACILGDYPVPRHMWICIVAGGTSSSLDVKPSGLVCEQRTHRFKGDGRMIWAIDRYCNDHAVSTSCRHSQDH